MPQRLPQLRHAAPAHFQRVRAMPQHRLGVAIAGAAQTAGEQHEMLLVIFGLVVSIPIIVWGSQLVLKLMDRFPIIILLGGMLLGWIAGTMMHSDPALVPYIPQDKAVHYAMGVAGALLVLAIGKWVQSRRSPPPASAA